MSYSETHTRKTHRHTLPKSCHIALPKSRHVVRRNIRKTITRKTHRHAVRERERERESVLTHSPSCICCGNQWGDKRSHSRIDVCRSSSVTLPACGKPEIRIAMNCSVLQCISHHSIACVWERTHMCVCVCVCVCVFLSRERQTSSSYAP